MFVLDLKGYGWILWEGLSITIMASFFSLLLAMVMGLIGAWGKLSRNKAANLTTTTYTTVIRGIPELLLLLIIFYGTRRSSRTPQSPWVLIFASTSTPSSKAS